MVYKAACIRLSPTFGETLAPYLIRRIEGDPLYRYVGYRSSMPQPEDAGRTIWSPLNNDKWNRWTGAGIQEGEGAQGLYLSSEFLDIDKPFPELEHYMGPGSDPEAMISYFKYQANKAPELTVTRAESLRSMFLFSLKNDIEGLNLRYSEVEENELLDEILQMARDMDGEAFSAGDTLQSLYYSGEDASFCRAIGNGVLDSTDLNFFETTSVRDGLSGNVIIRGEFKSTIDVLKPQGRASFFLNPETGGCEGVFTISDLLYNAVFEDPNAHTVLPSKQELNIKLREVSQEIAGNLVDAYQGSLETNPPTDAMEEAGMKISSIKDYLDDNRMEEAVMEIDEVKQTMGELLSEKQRLKDYEIRTFEVVDSVMGSLSDISTAIDVGRQEIENPWEAPENIDDIDFSDPPLEDVDPVIEPPKDL